MKSRIAVLMDGAISDITEQLHALLERHRLDEESLESIQAHHWDYWYFPSAEHFDDRELKETYSFESVELLNNATFVRNLPSGYVASGVIDCNGRWTDLQDFGWRLIDEPSQRNEAALEKWHLKFHELLSENNDSICVQVVIHC